MKGMLLVKKSKLDTQCFTFQGVNTLASYVCLFQSNQHRNMRYTAMTSLCTILKIVSI